MNPQGGNKTSVEVHHSNDADDDDDNVKQLQQCSSLYLLLQDCLITSNRDWKACQKEVQNLKACNEARQKNVSKHTKGGEGNK
uniref:cytochrome c oxidase assembly factor 4 homolog, mitochondrial n=1 Tax=Erigeron canadensis TaxID=72917 RepID=UPI001CB9AB8D|nr:cytochrome c oxidase assembly factor 4 homolog, mitochondrial [Erigeron canadensis]